jgi:hypothetical protein
MQESLRGDENLGKNRRWSHSKGGETPLYKLQVIVVHTCDCARPLVPIKPLGMNHKVISSPKRENRRMRTKIDILMTLVGERMSVRRRRIHLSER